ncbi:glutamyl-tRNA(Gln) amidotransferase, subunit E [Candidatus Methanoperedens nitroreducens]|uniref:Glutamyl-tRNA(Gln) amidotransferase subunit E n=1 Tax=Candidatus Methanoperedens nitratireducens TaxID=1392998 RepID=A0A062VAJ4_9EURY|nr:Glu-tRNA(Gln) amidotransferase subunit GatE [Candidatus Methanoperedens nitroreducens]KCZ72350.1 glutamyl-tRNA(Gln) amidotransferase, subunit E [Candidatus Methanoperedens nitroreducens]MDJ1423716.1 Glu-tRNA(Gln) amidotransferase subunit GatE [Candidatus Methanoperedens sp.]
MDHDYRALGLKAGLEIHQQLDTEQKLFCGSPTLLRDIKESNFEFMRYLRPTQSEMGMVDRAALEEVKFTKKFIYKAYDTTCLVEADEEPPRELNQEALDYALMIARMLNMKIVDELYTMRKIVIDGSNTSGFQRSGLLATQGYLDSSSCRVGIDVLCLEEEAAQKVEERKDSVVYSLDRLGIPLVEIGTAPDIISPSHAREVAEKLGMILRSTGKVKRGLGTIRQDINISIAQGARVEIKGVQALELIEMIVEREVARQIALLEIRDELRKRGASIQDRIVDVTQVFVNTSSNVILKALREGTVLAVNLPGFTGLVGKEIQPDRRLGTEFSDYAKKAGVGGIFHTDELPDYGITEDEVSALRGALGAQDKDCVVMVADTKERARGALEAVIARAKEALVGIPEETRRALPDGNSAYMRPLPGAARMYPETDVPPVEITEERIRGIKLPELIDERRSRYIKQFNLNEELAGMIARSEDFILFERIMQQVPNANATMVVRTLETTLPELEKEGIPVDNITEGHLVDLFRFHSEGKIPNEAIGNILRTITNKPELTVDRAAQSLGIGVETGELEAVIDRIIESKIDFIKERGLNSVGPLMGVVMKEFRGKVSGQEINRLLKEKISRKLGMMNS